MVYSVVEVRRASPLSLLLSVTPFSYFYGFPFLITRDYYYTWYYGTCTKNINQKEGTNNTALQEERTAKKEEEEVVD